MCEGLGRWRACFRAPPRRKRRRSQRRWPPHASAPWLAHTQRQRCAEIFLAHGTWQYKVRARRPFVPFLRRRSHGRLLGQHNRTGYPNARRARRHTLPGHDGSAAARARVLLWPRFMEGGAAFCSDCGPGAHVEAVWPVAIRGEEVEFAMVGDEAARDARRVQQKVAAVWSFRARLPQRALPRRNRTRRQHPSSSNRGQHSTLAKARRRARHVLGQCVCVLGDGTRVRRGGGMGCSTS